MTQRSRPSVLILLFCLGCYSTVVPQAPSENGAPDCPTIAVTCPDDSSPGGPLRFSASVKGGKRFGNLAFRWTVVGGRIKSGQGTDTIELDRSSAKSSFTGAVDIGGFDSRCAHSASCSQAPP